MYSILIVDDEYEIRKGLEAFDWESLGIELVGSCEHGLEAYQRLSTEQVNILLTDIHMPFMDGFELIRNVNRQFPYIKTVILTGYNDISYAQQGIRLGISDYLLKPVKDTDLIETFARVKQEMDSKKLIELQHATLERKANLTSHLIRQRFMQRLLFQHITQSEMEEGCSEGEMILDSGTFAVSILRLDRMVSQDGFYSHKEWKLILFVLENILTEVWDEKAYGYHWIDRNTGKCYLLCANQDILLNTGSDMITLTEIVKQITDNIQRFGGVLLSTLSLGVGPLVEGAPQIYLSCLTISNTLDAAIDKNSLVFEPDVTLTDTGLSPQNETEPHFPLREVSSQKIIDEAKQFIAQNFERSVTLQDVAEHIHINPNYLSSLFRKVTGENYIHYVTHCRMQQAIKLLQHSQYRVYEICEMVGYSTPAYFIDLFRKHTGKTPHEYRLSQGIKGDGEA